MRNSGVISIQSNPFISLSERNGASVSFCTTQSFFIVITGNSGYPLS